MKRTKADKLRLLSTNNKKFTTGGVSQKREEDAREEEEQTLHKKGLVRFGHRAPLGGSVLEESPNDYELCGKAPSDPVEAEAYYNVMLAEYGKAPKTKEEAAMCKFSIAKIVMGEYRDMKENKLKNIERCLTHLNDAEQALTLKKFPVTFAVINAMKAHLYRDRALYLTSKDYVPNRGVAASQLDIGLKVAEDALGPLCAAYVGYGKDARMIEQACLRLETGWLLLLRVNDTTTDDKVDQIYEYGIGHLERALSLFEKFMELFESESAFLSGPGEEAKHAWVPDVPSTHPSHIKALLRGRPLKTIHGTCLCLLGCAYMNWREDPEASSIAFEYLSNSVRPSMLTRECPHWVIAHHFLAKVILREPSLINRRRGASTAVDGVAHIDSAINHLNMGLTSPVCQRWFYELHFQIGLSHLIRLYSVTDKLKASSAIAAAMSQKHNSDIMELVESHLLQTLKGVTVANKGGVEAYLFFFSSLKMAELRIIQAVAKNASKSSAPSSVDAQRASLLKSATGFVTETLHARKCEENMDLNYLAIAQVCFLLSSSHRFHLAIRCYARAMMSISCMMNRLRFLPGVNSIVTKHSDLSSASVPTGSPEYSAIVPDEESTRISCFAIACCSKVTEWQNICPYEDGIKRNTATTKHAQLLSVRRADGSFTTTKRQWIFESNNIDVEVIKPPTPEPEPVKPESSKGHLQHKKKPRLGDVVEKEYIANPLEDGGVKQKKIRNEVNFFQRMQSYFSESRKETEKKIIKTSEDGFSAAASGTSSIGSRFKRSILPSKLGPTAIVCSEQSFYVMSILSRLSRILLLRTAFDLGASRGERARFLLCGLGNDGLTRRKGLGVPAAIFKELKHIQKLILTACEKYPVPPGSIRDLSVRPQKDINKIFKSQLRVTKLLYAEEQCLFQDICRHDTFLPMITSTCVLTRGISRFDRHLFDENTLLAQDEEADSEDSDDSSSEEGDMRKFREDDSGEEDELERLSEGSDDEKKPKKLQRSPKTRYVTKSLKKHSAKPGHKLVNIPEAVMEPVKISNNRRVERGHHGTNVDISERENDDDNNEGDEPVDDLDVEDVDKISPLLCSVLDGTLSTLREVLIENLKEDDIMLVWHMSVATLGGNHSLEVSAVWWDDTSTNEDEEDHHSAGSLKNNRSRGHGKDHGGKKRNLILETAKLEADTSRVTYLLQSLLDALNARSSTLRSSMSIDAIRALSECFAIGEVLQMAPTYVKNIIICCPPELRLVPWHALSVNLPDYMIPSQDVDLTPAAGEGRIERSEAAQVDEASPLNPIDEGDERDERDIRESQKTKPDASVSLSEKSQKYTATAASPEEIRRQRKKQSTGRNQQIFVIEKYAVMLGPTLSLFEMNSNKLRRVDHTAGNHKMCCVDGDSKISPARHSFEECESISKTWSSDPWDCVTLKGLDASVSNLTTKVDKKKRQEQEERENNSGVSVAEGSFMHRKFRPAQFKKKGRSAMISKKSRKGNDNVMGAFVYAFSGFMSGGRNARNYARKENPDESSESSEGEEEDDEIEEQRLKAREYCDNSLTFLTCRVLHMCASKVVCPTPSSVPAAVSGSGVTSVGGGSKTGKRHRAYPSLMFPLGANDARTMLTARDLVAQLFLRNCNLCVLSRYGITDGNIELISLAAEWEYIDALHLAGSATVLYPLWGGTGVQPGSNLSRLLFLLRFYFELPLFAAHSHPAAEACRQAQLWLKDCSVTDVKLFLEEAPIDPPLRKAVGDELSHFQATCDMSTRSIEDSKLRLFKNYLLWAPFAISGPGTQIHPHGLVETKKVKKPIRSSFLGNLFSGKHEKVHVMSTQQPSTSMDEISDRELRREAEILRREGGIELADAAEAELRRRRQAKVDEVKRRMSELKEAAELKIVQMKKLRKVAGDRDSGSSSEEEEVDMASRNAKNPAVDDDSLAPVTATAIEPLSPMPNSAVRLAPLTALPGVKTPETAPPGSADEALVTVSVPQEKGGMSASAVALAAARRQSRHQSAATAAEGPAAKSSQPRAGRI